jgi:hypothetical protein
MGAVMGVPASTGGSSIALGIAFLVLFTCPVRGGQQSTDPAANAGMEERSASTTTSSLPQVTVRAQREAIQKQAQAFVRKITGSAWAIDDGEHLLAVWRMPVCPIVAGLARAQGQFIFDRVTEVVTSAGAHPGKSGCHPNLYIVVTNQPVEILTAWYKRDRRMFDKPMPAVVKNFISRPLPVRIWYNTQLSGKDGDLGSDQGTIAGGSLGGAVGQVSTGAEMNAGGQMNSNGQTSILADIPIFQDVPGGSRLRMAAVHDLASVIVIVDFKQMQGLSWDQIADYIAMAALTNVDPDHNFSDVPSILALFNTAVQSRPHGLTDWDSAYLKALYHTERMSRLQRVSIALEIAREMDPSKRPAAP